MGTKANSANTPPTVGLSTTDSAAREDAAGACSVNLGSRRWRRSSGSSSSSELLSRAIIMRAWAGRLARFELLAYPSDEFGKQELAEPQATRGVV